MLSRGQRVRLDVEKAAAGGRMLGRVDGHVVLVADAIPGEQVVAEITAIRKGVAFAETRTVESASPDRVAPFTDSACGGTAYAHIAYARQLTLKGDIISDALRRIGRIELPERVDVRASRPDGYRMRARLHRVGGRVGFFREGTHQACDARATRQLLDSTCDTIDLVAEALARTGPGGVREIEVAENVDASQRAFHFESNDPIGADALRTVGEVAGVSGVLVTAPARLGRAPETRLIAGDPYVTDRMLFGPGTVAFRRHVRAFFQGNRYLLRDLVDHVLGQITTARRVTDLYAGVGLFAVAAAASLPDAAVVAVESDPFAARDLEVNASALPQPSGRVTVAHRTVEHYLTGTPEPADAVVLDPPRTGTSPEALTALAALAPPRIVYVSCDVATLARDLRQLVAAGYRPVRVDGFDLFPNTAHVETVVVLVRG